MTEILQAVIDNLDAILGTLSSGSAQLLGTLQ